MNKIDATLTVIEHSQGISVVSFGSSNQHLKMMSLDLDESMKVGVKVRLGVKASSISIAKNLRGELSIANQLKSTVVSVNNGTLLSSVKLRFGDFILESIITSESSKRLDLQENDAVIALIKSSDLSILELLK